MRPSRLSPFVLHNGVTAALVSLNVERPCSGYHIRGPFKAQTIFLKTHFAYC